MQNQAKAPARLLAVLALVGALVALVVVISSSSTDDGGDPGTVTRSEGQDRERPRRTKAASYVVRSGDTLTAIAHRTGVPVQEIIALNPEIDPQILIAGQTLKLK